VQKPHPYRTGTVIGRRRVGAMERRPGRSAEAKALLQPVYDRFTEGFGTTDLKSPQALLDALAEPYAPRTRTSRPNATSGMAGAGYFAKQNRTEFAPPGSSRRSGRTRLAAGAESMTEIPRCRTVRF